MNNTWEIALCNTSTCDYHNSQYKFSRHISSVFYWFYKQQLLTSAVNNNDSGTPGNLSISEGSNSVTLNWSQPLHNYSITCCPAPYYYINCACEHYSNCHGNSSQSATITELKSHTVYKCCVWVNEEQSLCQYAQTLQAGKFIF